MKQLKKVFFQFWFSLAGWKIIGEPPNLDKYIIIVAPHTSNWDFFIGLAARYISGLHSDFLGKKSLFTIPLVGWFMRSIGGHPVDRSKNTNLVDQVVELYNSHKKFVLAVAPEGTRSYVEKWKTGFYHIAVKANIPIAMVGFHFPTKTVEFKELFYPTGALEKDMEYMLSYYRTVVGKYPEKGIR